MPRGVKAGSKRGCYTRFSEPRLRKLARDIRQGKVDRAAVAQAFESTKRVSDFLIASQLREQKEFNLNRLAQAVEALGAPQRPVSKSKLLPLWVSKGALRHLAKEHGGRGEPIHQALGVE